MTDYSSADRIAQRAHEYRAATQDGSGRDLESPVLALVKVVIGLIFVCAGLLAIRHWAWLLEGGWYLPSMLAFMAVMMAGGMFVVGGGSTLLKKDR